MRFRFALVLCLGLSAGLCAQNPVERIQKLNAGWPARGKGPWTRAEATEFRETTLHGELEVFVEQVLKGTAEAESDGRRHSMGRSARGLDIPVIVLSRHGAFDPESAQKLGKPIVMVLANIHAGEVDGKEAVLMLIRDILGGVIEPFHRDMTLVLVPDYNPDGNDAINPENRALHLKELWGQLGPEGGVGTRATAEGIDLNRDYLLLRAPESRHLNRLFHAWKPHVFIDCHTTNGSIHGYELTYDTAHNPESGPSAPILYTRDVMLPAVGNRLQNRRGFRTFFYGNFRDNNDPRSGWETYPALPRYGSHFRGLTGCLDILLESYSYADFRTRTHVMYEVMREIFQYVVEQGDVIRKLVDNTRLDIIRRGRNPDPSDRIGINYTVLNRDAEGRFNLSFPVWPLFEFDVASYDLESIRAKQAPGRVEQTYRSTYYGRFVPTKSVNRPLAYVIRARDAAIVDHLRLHGIQVETQQEHKSVVAERGTVVAATPLRSRIGGMARQEVVIEVRMDRGPFELEPGDFVVTMAQPLANVAVYLLEAESDDGLWRWGLLPDLKVNDIFPIVRLPASAGEGGAQ